MKKLILLLFIMCLCGCTPSVPDSEIKVVTVIPITVDKETPTATPSPTATPTEEPTPTTEPTPTEDPMPLEEKVIRQRITEYTHTEITQITLNPDYGTEDENDYIALVYLTWDQKNSKEMSQQVLAMYSEDLSATVGEEAPNVQEIAIFWTIPYLNMNAKYSYERRDNGMYKTDEVWA